MASSTVENYLKQILLLSEQSGGLVSMGSLAASLAVVPGTVTTMVKSLASDGLVLHRPRQGVRLTDPGRTLALGVLRRHRLIETFLVNVLKMDWSRVHAEAEQLEHAVSDDVLDRLDALLGHPTTDPHGDPIPSAHGTLNSQVYATLATCHVGKPLRVVRVTDQTADFLQFARKSGLLPGAGVRVADLDSGIDDDHPDLAPNLNVGLSASFAPCLEGSVYDAAGYLPGGDGNCDGAVEDWRILPGFYFNHGTHTAGTIAGKGVVGVTGVAPDADLVAVKVCTEFFNACWTSSILEGLVYAADIDTDVVNMSLGGTRRMRNDFVKYCKDLGYPAPFCASLAGDNAKAQADYVHNTITVYRRAFQYAFNQGTTVVVSAGNDATDFDHSKDIWAAFADFPHVIGVSALGPVGWCLDPANTDLDQQAYYTNTGRSIVDVSAPGGNFYGYYEGLTDPCTRAGVTTSTYVFDGVLSTISEGWGWAQGTSMAAPHVTGVAALIIGAHGGSMSPAQVERILKQQAEDLGPNGVDPVYGAGRVSTGY